MAKLSEPPVSLDPIPSTDPGVPPVAATSLQARDAAEKHENDPGPVEVPKPAPSIQERLVQAGELPVDALAKTDPSSPVDPDATQDIDLENAQLQLAEMDANELYGAYSDRLMELNELSVTPWAGLNEAHKSAWRAVATHKRVEIDG
jgi:hypothetical protein